MTLKVFSWQVMVATYMSRQQTLAYLGISL